MRTFALVHDGVISRVVEADQNPFHDTLRVVEVTGIPAQVGNTVDAVGNVGPSVPLSAGDAADRKRVLLVGEAAYRSSQGVWLPSNDPAGGFFGTDHEELARLAALSEAGSPYSVASDGRLLPVSAHEAYAAASKYLADCLKRHVELQDEIDGNPDADMAAGWPETGEPAEKAPAVRRAAPARNAGTGIIPEQTADAPHAEPAFSVGGTVDAPVVQP